MSRRQLLVTLIGTDGSGKTSTTDNLFNLLSGTSCSVNQVWCGAESYLMKPVRGLLTLIRKNKSDPGRSEVSYKSEVDEKNRLSEKSGFLTSVYVFLVLLDYTFQYHWKMWCSRHARILLLDRYFFDVAVNLAITLGWSERQLIDFIQKHCGRYKFPDVRGFVYVPAEVSMSRKDDIPDIDYVNLRLKYYRAISNYYDFREIDGQGSIVENSKILYEEVKLTLNQRYVHYVHSNNEDVGGADFCLYRMADAVNNTQEYRCAISLRLRAGITKSYESSGIPIYMGSYCRPQLSRGVVPLLLLPFRSLYAVIYFWRLFLVQKPDIVHLNDLYDFLPAIAAKLAGIPSVYHIRMIRTSRLEIKIFGWVLKNFSRISFSVSEAVRKTYFAAPNLNQKTHSAQVVYDWPDDTLVSLSDCPQPEEFKKYKKNVVMVGRVEWWKGQHVFLDAVKRIIGDFPDVGFFLVGGMVVGDSKESYANDILASAQKLGVSYLGQRSDVSTLLTHADISVHASVTPDPFPGVVLESLLSKSATIGVDEGGVSEMIRHKIDGVKYKAGDASELASAIKVLLNDDELIYSYSESGRKRILEMAKKDKILQQTLNLYNEL